MRQHRERNGGRRRALEAKLLLDSRHKKRLEKRRKSIQGGTEERYRIEPEVSEGEHRNLMKQNGTIQNRFHTLVDCLKGNKQFYKYFIL